MAMLCGFRRALSWLLPALAVLAILGGPSQSAAFAQLQVELKHRQATEQAKRVHSHQDLPRDTVPTQPASQKPETPATPDQDCPNTNHTQKDEADSSFGSFVVIKAAKPADGPIVKVTLGLAACPLFDTQKKPQLPGILSQAVVSSTAQHHPAYRAQAPPRSIC